MPVAITESYEHTLSQIRTRVRSMILQSSSNTNWENDDIDVAVNLTLDEMREAGLTELSKWEWTSTADLQTFTPPEYVWRITRIDYDDERIPQMSEHDFDRLTGGDWDSLSGTPIGWYWDGEECWFSHVPSAAKEVRVFYEKRASDLASDDEVTGFYKAHTALIVVGTVSFLHEADSNGSASERWHQRFLRMLEGALFNDHQRHPSNPLIVYDHVGFGDLD